MKTFRWDPKKGDALNAQHGISFETILIAIESGGLLDILAHPNAAKYPRQQILVVSYDGYVYLVPYVEEDDCLFPKTIIPSRKATRNYLNRGESDAQD
jgi:uncharacterized DUF497 family protein